MMENTRPDEETAIGGMLSSTSFLDVTNLLPSEVARRFPGLEVLDSEAITQIGFTADLRLTQSQSFPNPVPSHSPVRWAALLSPVSMELLLAISSFGKFL